MDWKSFRSSKSLPGVLSDLGCKVWLQHLETRDCAQHHCLNAGKGRLRSDKHSFMSPGGTDGLLRVFHIQDLDLRAPGVSLAG